MSPVNSEKSDAVAPSVQYDEQLEAALEYASTTAEDDGGNFSWNIDVVANLFALYFTYFASTWAMTIPGASIAFIMYEFPQAGSMVAWISAVSSLCLCVITIFLGDLSDIFGRKWFLVLGNVCGIIGMIVAGVATNVAMIIGGQVFNGIALTLGYLSTPLMAEVVPKRSRAPILGGAALLVSLVGLAGNLSQGAFMKYDVLGPNKGWRVGFFIGAGIFAVALVSLLAFYRPGPRPNPEGFSARSQLLKIDWIGIILAFAGLLLLLLGLQFGGQPDYSWNSAMVVAFLVLGAVLVLTCLIWEWLLVKDGMFPRALFHHRNYSVTLLLNFVEGMLIFSAQAFMPQIILSLLTTDFFLSVVYNLPNAFFTMIAAISCSWIAAKTKEAKWVAVAGVACLTLGSGLMAIMKPGVGYGPYAVASALLGMGIGCLGVIIHVISTLATPDRYIATAVSIGTSIRGLGGAIGMVIATLVYSNQLTMRLPAYVVPAIIGAGLPPSSVPAFMNATASQNPILIQQVPGVTPAVLEAWNHANKSAYADSYRYIWFVIIPFGAVAIFIALCLKSTKEQMTLEVASAVRSHFQNGAKMGNMKDAKEKDNKAQVC